MKTLTRPGPGRFNLFSRLQSAYRPAQHRSDLMQDPRIDAITIDLTALEAIVRGLARSHAARSRTSLVDLLASLTEEADRIRSCPTFSGVNRSAVCGVLEAWVEDLKVETWVTEGATIKQDQTA